LGQQRETSFQILGQKAGRGRRGAANGGGSKLLLARFLAASSLAGVSAELQADGRLVSPLGCELKGL